MTHGRSFFDSENFGCGRVPPALATRQQVTRAQEIAALAHLNRHKTSNEDLQELAAMLDLTHLLVEERPAAKTGS